MSKELDLDKPYTPSNKKPKRVFKNLGEYMDWIEQERGLQPKAYVDYGKESGLL